MDDYLELERFSLDGEVLYNDLVFKYFAGFRACSVSKFFVVVSDWRRLVGAGQGLQGTLRQRGQPA